MSVIIISIYYLFIIISIYWTLLFIPCMHILVESIYYVLYYYCYYLLSLLLLLVFIGHYFCFVPCMHILSLSTIQLNTCTYISTQVIHIRIYSAVPFMIINYWLYHMINSSAELLDMITLSIQQVTWYRWDTTFGIWSGIV